MKSFIVIAVFLLFSAVLNAQKDKNTIELGSPLLTLNNSPASRFMVHEKPRVEYLNGLFFRFNKKRFAFRAILTYSQYSFEESYTSGNTVTNGHRSKDARIGPGVQLIPFKKLKSLYFFTDVLYRYVSSEGFSATDRPNVVSTYYLDSRGIDAFAGWGITVELFKRFCLSQELALNARYQKLSYSHNFAQFGPYSYSVFNVNPNFRLSLLYRLPKTVFKKT